MQIKSIDKQSKPDRIILRIAVRQLSTSERKSCNHNQEREEVIMPNSNLELRKVQKEQLHMLLKIQKEGNLYDLKVLQDALNHTRVGMEEEDVAVVEKLINS